MTEGAGLPERWATSYQRRRGGQMTRRGYAELYEGLEVGHDARPAISHDRPSHQRWGDPVNCHEKILAGGKAVRG
jgi:hypothetical protein